MPAGGHGARLGASVPKQYLDLNGRPMLARAARSLLAAPWVEQLVVVAAPGDPLAAQALAGLPRTVLLSEGGATRRDSVLAGLRHLAQALGAGENDWVLVHDAARPALAPAALAALRDALADDPVGGLLALPVSDTVKRGDAGARVVETIPRDGLWLAQTPQMFRFGPLRAALERFPDVTDESAAIERLGLEPRLVAGGRENFKVTTTDDLELMRRLSAAAAPAIRVGQGWDIHALVPERPLIVGGVNIPHDRGLLGHSDADVLLHAITDALLGAAALGDIGRHFPDTDPVFAGADSAVLLAEAARRVRAAGFEIGNLDATIIAQAPKMAPHIPAMVVRIAEVLAIDAGCVNVKAKTSERLGHLGRGEGIAAEAVVLLARPAAGSTMTP
jgi:2-C-methyl-D-erythritol 4-phosphate cytidylyltransferase/2-C-methyl-D-erythritol 2,4-cyclodiphosphate synthase